MYSIRLLTNAVRDQSDLNCWMVNGRQRSSFVVGQVSGVGGGSPFTIEALREFVDCKGAALRKAGFEDLADSLDALDVDLFSDIGEIEHRLTAVEEEMIARLRGAASAADLQEARGALDLELRPYHGKMSADQIAMLKTQFLDRKLLKSAGLSRLSLYYL